jgi:EAL domain-containing protein (putative c-di-GMP-specific phosphodiesterase class I)
MSSSAQQTVDGNTDGIQSDRSSLAPASTWHLVGQIDPSEGTRHIPIHMDPFLIGRRNDSSLCLPSDTVSSMHAEITRAGGNLMVRDLHSTNGTYVNGLKVQDTCTLLENDVVQFSDMAFRIGREDACWNTQNITAMAGDRAMVLIQFEKLIEGQGLVPHFQPIVRLQNLEVMGYEVLGRSSLFGLKKPSEMFQVAEQLDLQNRLSQLIRQEGVRQGIELDGQVNLFLNVHPGEMVNSYIVDTLSELRKITATHPITLEIHEKVVTNVHSMRKLKSILRDLDIGLAYDDFGAGQARLVEIVEVPPDYLKFDMQLIKNIDQASASRQQMLQALVKMVHDLGIITIAECIEGEAESVACQQFGFDLAQGFFHGKPAPIEHYRSG